MALLDHPLPDRAEHRFATQSGSSASRLDITSGRLRDTSFSVSSPGLLYRNWTKRAVDLLLVVVTLPFWLPIILVTAAMVASDGRNPFYTQKRIGQGGRVFRMIKLRSMVHDADAVIDGYLRENPAARLEWDATQKLKSDPRITPVGRFIRKSSIDELPQLFNVLLGDMSLVGPRPMMVSQKALYPGSRYYDMRPGLTGFWQISSRNHSRFVDRARYDNAYHAALSLRTDMAVILRTIGVVLRGTGY
jgi:lipopolysaccharide/colanic/teichoic acid biosynthesis glycosyltransferase